MNPDVIKNAMDNLSNLLDYTTEQSTSYWIIVSDISDDGWAEITRADDNDIRKNDLALIFGKSDMLCTGIFIVDELALPKIHVTLEQKLENPISLEAVKLNSTLSAECKEILKGMGEA